MKAFAYLLISCALLVGSAKGQDFDPCDGKLELEKGEKLSAPFFGIDMVMGVLAAAEIMCDAKGLEWERTFSRYVVENGCPLDSHVGRGIVESARKLRDATAAELFSGFTAKTLSPEELASAKRQMDRELGGCEGLLKTYRATVEANAPKAGR